MGCAVGGGELGRFCCVGPARVGLDEDVRCTHIGDVVTGCVSEAIVAWIVVPRRADQYRVAVDRDRYSEHVAIDPVGSCQPGPQAPAARGVLGEHVRLTRIAALVFACAHDQRVAVYRNGPAEFVAGKIVQPCAVESDELAWRQLQQLVASDGRINRVGPRQRHLCVAGDRLKICWLVRLGGRRFGDLQGRGAEVIGGHPPVPEGAQGAERGARVAPVHGPEFERVGGAVVEPRHRVRDRGGIGIGDLDEIAEVGAAIGAVPVLVADDRGIVRIEPVEGHAPVTGSGGQAAGRLVHIDDDDGDVEAGGVGAVGRVDGELVGVVGAGVGGCFEVGRGGEAQLACSADRERVAVGARQGPGNGAVGVVDADGSGAVLGKQATRRTGHDRRVGDGDRDVERARLGAVGGMHGDRIGVVGAGVGGRFEVGRGGEAQLAVGADRERVAVGA